jgi:heme exporter protein D
VPARGLLEVRCYRRHASLQGAWGRQAVPARWLHQVCCRRTILQGARRGQAVPARWLHQVRRRRTILQGARRGQAVPRGGLFQGSCSRRHGSLQVTRRGQAVPALGLPQGSCCRWHASLQGTWRRQALPARGLLQGSRSSSRQHALHAVSAAHTAAARRFGGAVMLRTRPGTQLRRLVEDFASTSSPLKQGLGC